MVIQGLNPYVITPQSYMEAGNVFIPQAQTLLNGMGNLNSSHFSSYPPLNQLCFALASIFSKNSIYGSVFVLHALIILSDIGILYFGRKLLKKMNIPVHKIFWYFLNPFIIIELTGNLHFEGVMLFFLIWALYLLSKQKWIVAALLLGLSISVKLIPLIFLPLFFQWFANKKKSVKGLLNLFVFYALAVGTFIFSFVPFLTSEIISNFLDTIGLWFRDFEFNAGIYYIIRWIGFKTIGWNIIEDVGKILPVVVASLVFLLAFLKNNKSMTNLIAAMLFAGTIYFLLATTVHPWYIATLLLLSIFTKYRFPLVWSFVVILSYTAYGKEGFSENLWLVAIEYIVVTGFLLWELLTTRRNIKLTVQELN